MRYLLIQNPEKHIDTLLDAHQELERRLALAQARIAELEKALRGVLAEADRDTDAFIFARRILKDRP